jgi:Tc toxin complex TcA C-terminal TcB-binding domain
MAKPNVITSFHDQAETSYLAQMRVGHSDTQFTYTFENFFHPLVGQLIAKLNKDSLPGMMDAEWQESLRWNSLVPKPDSPAKSFDDSWKDSQKLGNQAHSNYFRKRYSPTFPSTEYASKTSLGVVNYFPKEIDVSSGGPYSNYNWELFFHIPLTIAVHLSKTQRFAEAQRWFHYIFDPTSTDPSVELSKRFWKFLAFRDPKDSKRIEDIVQLLSIPDDKNNADQQAVLDGYYEILSKPFQPHPIARSAGRQLAYQYCVVMKYLDNLIAWGDNLFLQDTLESINEATQIYVLAANVLGERPQQIPPQGKVKANTFAQLKEKGLGPIGDAFVELEVQFPFNLLASNLGGSGNGSAVSSPLFGIGRTLYFCIPRNDKLLSYWDTVADRLFKIRHCMNIAGVVRPLALFDPPIDPGMLVKAAAAGIDIGSIVSGLNQPVGPVRCLILIQKASELCGEARSLGNALLSALEKGDAEHLALIRQRHEIQIQQMAQEVRFLQWKSAQEATTSLLTSRATALERLRYYQRLLGLPADQNAPDTLTVDHSERPDALPKLTEENFDEAYQALVGQYDKTLTLQKLSDLELAGDTSPGMLSGFSGSGKVYLTHNEDVELNIHLPVARDATLLSSTFHATAATLTPIPDPKVNLHYWGLGGTIDLKVGTVLSTLARLAGDIAGITASWERDQAGMASHYASYERRADEWLLQYNLAAHELMQIGRQILTSLIAEQIAQHEYRNIQQQIKNTQEIQEFLDAVNFPDKAKFTNEELYLWMQGEISRLYYEYYRFAFDTARKAEKTMKQELMRPEVDAQDFVKFNYWDGGRKGLLSGEALYLDVKRLEMAYHDNNKRELELTKHVSLRQLNPIALLTLKATGTCQVTIPEWLYDLHCPGHYMRRIRNVALSIPSVVGPYTSVNCTLSLLKSSVRKSPIGDDYGRQGSEDDRFIDYIGAVQSIVTSSGQNDSGMFETNLREERFLPFEGAGAEGTWKLDLPKDYPAFDYATISDVILHIRYTARQGVIAEKVKAALADLFQQANQAGLALLFSLRHDFPTEWSAFVNSKTNADFTATIRKNDFPYFTQGRTINLVGLELYDGKKISKHHPIQDDWTAKSDDLNDKSKQAFSLTAPADAAGPTQVLTPTAGADAFVIVRYSFE